MKWSFVFTLALLFVVSAVDATNQASQALELKDVTKWLEARYEQTKKDNKRYEAGSCYRKAKFAKNGACDAGFKLQFMGLCTADCPLETPVKCGPVCLPQGRSCVYEMAKKVSVVGLLFIKVHKMGFFGMDKLVDACLDSLKSLDVTTSQRRLAVCDPNLDALMKLDEDEFAELMKELFPPPATARHRQLKTQGATECGNALFEAITGVVSTAKKSSKDGLGSKEALLADAGLMKKIGDEVTKCFDDAPEEIEKYGSSVEIVVKALIELAFDASSVGDVANAVVDVGIKHIKKLDKNGILGLVHEYYQEFCKLPAAPQDDYSKDVKGAAAMKTELGLNGLGVFKLGDEDSSWSPANAQNKVYLTVTNNLKETVKIKLYSGGRTLKEDNKAKSKVVEMASTKVVVLDMPLAEVYNRTLYMDAVIERSWKEALSETLKGFLNAVWKTMSFGIAEQAMTTKDYKLGSVVMWVPKLSQEPATGLLLVHATMVSPKDATT